LLLTEITAGALTLKARCDIGTIRRQKAGRNQLRRQPDTIDLLLVALAIDTTKPGFCIKMLTRLIYVVNPTSVLNLLVAATTATPTNRFPVCRTRI